MNNTRHKVVLVDDNIATLNQGKSLLQAFYKVYTVQKAATLFENLEEDIPDLILLDVEMPEMDGFETIKKLKADPRYKDIPVIFLTSKSDEESERKGFSLGAVDYITKPFSGPLLQKRISNQILYMRVQDAVKNYSDDLDIMMDEVAKANERTKILMEKTPLCARLWNKDMELIDCNEAAVKLFGFRDKKECLERYPELYPEFQPDGARSTEKVKEHIQKAFKDGVCEVKWMYQMPDGTPMPAIVILVRVEYDNDYAVVGYTRDLREYNKMLATIMEGEERLRLMLDAMPFACRLFGLNYEFIDCNQAALDLVGVTNKEDYREKSGQIVPEFQPCGGRSNVLRMQHLDTAFEKGYTRFEWMYRKLNGDPLPVEITMVRVMLNGEYIIAGYARDLSEQKAVIEEMRRAEIAEESNKAKSRFLATMSHEIRTPMNSIIGFAELALDLPDASSIEESKVYLSKIKSSSQWLLSIINDILDISKIEANKIELEHVPFDLQHLIMRCQSVVLPDIIDKGLDLKINYEPIIGRKLLGDPTRIYQVLMNLLTNAIKFTNDGIIEFSTGIKIVDENKVSIYMEVKDNGIGITPEQAKIIFDPFTQAESSITRNYGGTGLGLPISKNLIELMGGELRVNSTPGIGSCFHFELFFDSIVDANDSDSGDVTVGGYDKPNFEGEILVCEDNNLNQQVISDHLSRVGLKYVIAQNGKEGVDIVTARAEKDEKPFDLILMDIHMPIMNGLEAAAAITKMKTGTPIVALTADLMSDGIKTYTSCGISGIIGKPFTSQELWNGLKKHLQVKSYTSSNNRNQRDKDKKILAKLKVTFAKSNHDIFFQITEALQSGDIKTAHRIVHTLKSNAGQIGEKNLMAAAKIVESQLSSGENRTTPETMNVLEVELKSVLGKPEFLPSVKKVSEKPVYTKETHKLLEQLESTLKDKNAYSLMLADELSSYPGMEQLVELIENFNFPQALKTLRIIKNEMEVTS